MKIALKQETDTEVPINTITIDYRLNHIFSLGISGYLQHCENLMFLWLLTHSKLQIVSDTYSM